MHIPSSMLNGAICPVTVGVGIAGGMTALYFARKAEEKPSAAKFATVTAMIFALQMLNFPVQNGTSGHLLGGMLAVALLGVPFAALSIAIVLGVQAVFFGDGGVFGPVVLGVSAFQFLPDLAPRRRPKTREIARRLDRAAGRGQKSKEYRLTAHARGVGTPIEILHAGF